MSEPNLTLYAVIRLVGGPLCGRHGGREGGAKCE